MSMMSLSVSVTKMTRRAPHAVELWVTPSSSAEPADLWPQLVRAILAAAPGAPAELAEEAAGVPTLLKVRGGEGCWRIPVHDAALAGALSKGLSWSLPHPPVRKPTLTDGAWTPDGKSALLAQDNHLARLVGVTKKGVGRVKALLSHPDLCAVGCGDGVLMTAGGTTVRLWDAKGKKVTATHTTPAEIVAACFVGASVVVGLADGSVRRVDGVDIVTPGAAAVTALASRDDRLAAGFADGRVMQWDASGSGDVVATGAAVTSLGLDAEGGLLIGRADGSVTARGATHTVPAGDGLRMWTIALSPDGGELLVAHHGLVCAVSLADGTVTPLIEAHGIHTVQYSPSGGIRVAAGSDPDRIYLWDRDGNLLRVVSGLPIYSLRAHHREKDMIAFSPDEQLAAIHRREERYKNGAVVVFEVRGGGSLLLPNDNADYAWAEGVVWVDGQRLLVSYSNEKDKLWTLPGTAQVFDECNFSSQLIRTAAGVAICSPRSFEADVFTLRAFDDDLSVTATFPLQGLFGSSYPPTMQISDDGTTALLTNPFQDIVLVQAGEEPWRLEGTASGFERALLSGSGRWMLVYGKDKRIQIWDVAARKVRSTVTGVDYHRPFFRPDDTVLLVCSEKIESMSLDGERTVLLDGISAARQVGPITAISALPDGRVLSTAGALQHWSGPGVRRLGFVSRRGGITRLSPDGDRALVVTAYGAMVVTLREL